MSQTTFTTPGSHSYTVPSEADTVVVKCWGAGGGDAAASGSATGTTTGAAGGYAEGEINVSGGETLTVVVGGAGPTPASATDSVGGGTPNGGSGGTTSNNTADAASGGGGGNSRVDGAGSLVVAPGGAAGSAIAVDASASITIGTTGGGGEDGADVGELSGGVSGNAAGDAGEDAELATVSHSGENAAFARGGGGAGDNGGTSASGALFDTSTSPSTAESGGSAGGAFTTSSVANATTTVAGGNAGDGKVVIEEPPAAPSGLTATENAGDIDLSWSDNATSEAGYHVYRATSSGSSTSDYTQIADIAADSTSYTDTTASDDGEKYYYRVAAYDSLGERLSNEDSVITPLPAATNFSIDSVSGDQFNVSWTDNANNEDGYRVFVSTDGGATFSQDGGDLAANTTSTTTTNLLDGRDYTIKVRAFTSHATADSGTDADTTVLPDADQPVLGNGVEDEIAVDREAQVHDNGDVRWQVRETGETSWSGSAVGFDEATVDHATITFAITGREDGEEYEVRLRTETADATGAWTTPVSIVTQFPGATNLSASNVTQTSLDLSWTDNADNEAGFDVERRKQVGGTFGAWQTVASLSPNTTTYTDSSVQPGRTFEYRIEAFTDDAEANSSAIQVTTTSSGVRQRRVPSQGWHVEIDTN